MQILDKPIQTDVQLADEIAQAIYILHNTIIDREGIQYNLRHLNLQCPNPTQMQQAFSGTAVTEAKYIRDTFKI